MAFRDVDGRHFVYKGTPLDVIDDTDSYRWLRLADVRKIVTALPADRVLRSLHPEGLQDMSSAKDPASRAKRCCNTCRRRPIRDRCGSSCGSARSGDAGDPDQGTEMTQDRWQSTADGPRTTSVPVPRSSSPWPGSSSTACASARPAHSRCRCGTGIVGACRPCRRSHRPHRRLDINAGMLAIARGTGPPGVPHGMAGRRRVGAFLCGRGIRRRALQGLQFFDDRPAALREMHRALAPGGLLAICVWRAIRAQPLPSGDRRGAGAPCRRRSGPAIPGALSFRRCRRAAGSAHRCRVLQRGGPLCRGDARLVDARGVIPGLLASTAAGPACGFGRCGPRHWSMKSRQRSRLIASRWPHGAAGNAHGAGAQSENAAKRIAPAGAPAW